MKTLLLFTLIALILSGCSPAAAATIPPNPTQPVTSLSTDFGMDVSGIAQNVSVEMIVVPTPTPGGWQVEAAPRYRLVTLQGYPVANKKFQPQIYIYPVADMAGFNEIAAQMPATLKTALDDQLTFTPMPFLPLINAKQDMHPLVKFLDSKNGKGVRYLTQFAQAPIVINNEELIYTFQGLTGDGKYYIAAVLPVTHAELPVASKVYSDDMEKLKEFPAYLEKTTAWLDQQPGTAFTPDLAKLDSLVQSIEIK